MRDAICCTCHALSVQAFECARAAGAQNVKTGFQFLGCTPKCAKCVPRVRKLLSGEAARQTIETPHGVSSQPNHLE